MYDGFTWTAYSASDLGSGFNGGIGNFTEDDPGRIHFLQEPDFAAIGTEHFNALKSRL